MKIKVLMLEKVKVEYGHPTKSDEDKWIEKEFDGCLVEISSGALVTHLGAIPQRKMVIFAAGMWKQCMVNKDSDE